MHIARFAMGALTPGFSRWLPGGFCGSFKNLARMSEFVLFVVPFYKLGAAEFMNPFADMEGVTLGIISQDPEHYFPEYYRQRMPIETVHDITSWEALLHASQSLARRYGKPRRIVSITEQVQVQVAMVREHMGIDGMSVEAIRGFRDKGLMKEKFRKAGVPCARHVAAYDKESARKFAEEVGFPLCVKPIDGAASQATFKVENAGVLEEILHASAPNSSRPLQIEEFVTGEEHSFETLSVNGKHLWHSLTHYEPTPLNVMQNPWIQWRIYSPKEVTSKKYNDIKKAAKKALDCLGMETGLTHLEWFRRTDGTVAVNEVAARPPGAQICTLMNRSHDMDLFRIWAEMMMWDHLPEIPKRKYATGAVFLRGLGGARVKAVHGLEVLQELGDMVTDMELPYPGQTAANTYEGEGFVCVRHPETDRVREAIELLTDRVRVEMI